VYGSHEDASLRARIESVKGMTTTATVYRGNQALGSLTLQVPGQHNVQNALAALAVAFELDVPWDVAKEALARYSGVRRRFEMCGEFEGVMLVDDYAHHPTEVSATLQAARAGFPDRRLVALFQPHLYSRTQQFASEFGAALMSADVVFITDVYPSREAPLPGVSGALVADAVKQREHRHVYYIEHKTELAEHVKPLLSTGDMLVTMGAGDIGRLGRALFESGGAS
jgi:UDP-N-acetylmuramate--alanine ligase